MMKKQYHYYAMNWSHGRAACAITGRRYGVSFHKFNSRRERTDWMSEGGDYTSSPNFREEVSSKDSELRLADDYNEINHHIDDLVAVG